MTFAWPVTWALRVFAGLVLIILYGPLAVAVALSFFDQTGTVVNWSSFGLQWYGKLFANRGIGEALLNTFIVGAGTVVASVVLGTLFALYFQYGGSRWRGLHQAIIVTPFLLPPIVTGLSLLIFFREAGVPRSLVTVVIGHTVLVLALVYRTILQRLQSLSPRLIEASYDLGATRAYTFRRVLLPHLASAAVAAGVLAFALSFDETLITLLVTGSDNTLPLRLWAMVRTGFTPDMNALITLILVATAVLSVAVIRLVRPSP